MQTNCRDNLQTIKQALEAKKIENDRPLRKDQPRVRVGWGKSVPCQRLWVWGLGDWTSEELLFREFDRYGVIDKVDYKQGDEHAYITFDSIQSASDACAAMKNYALGGQGRVIRVDYAQVSGTTRQPHNLRQIHECTDLRLPAGNTAGSGGRDRSPDRKRKRSRTRSSSGRSHSRGSSESRSESPPPARDGKKKKQRSGPRTPPDTPPLHASKKSRRDRSSSGSSRRSSRSSSRDVARRKSSSATKQQRKQPHASRRSQSRSSRGNSAPRDISKSRSPTPELIADTVEQLTRIRQPVWTGMLVLKKSAYNVRLYKLHGYDDRLFDSRMRDTNREAVKLHITQRLPWAANNLAEKFGDPPADSAAQYLLAVPNTDTLRPVSEFTAKPMQGLVAYLNEKAAAGVVALCAGANVYVFPKCALAERIIKRVAPRIGIMDTTPALLLALQP